MLASKQLAEGKLSIIKIENYTVTLQYGEEKLTERKIKVTSKMGAWFRFKGTNWLLGYDFNLKLDDSGNVAAVEKKSSKGQYPFFVYGTLRIGMWNHYRFEDRCDKMVAAKTQGEIFHNGSYPYLFEGEGVVRGELMYVQPELYKRMLRHIDDLEGFNPKRTGKHTWNHYVRKLVTCITPDGEEVQAWAYFCGEERRKNHLTRIKDGDFVRWHNEYQGGYSNERRRGRGVR